MLIINERKKTPALDYLGLGFLLLDYAERETPTPSVRFQAMAGRLMPFVLQIT